MRRLALTACLLLTACGTQPIKPPKVVEVIVTKIVPVPAELTERIPVYDAPQKTVGEAVKSSNINKAGLLQCNVRLGLIEGLTP